MTDSNTKSLEDIVADLRRGRRRREILTIIGIVPVAVGIATSLVLELTGRYIAGQGDGLIAASKWAKDRRPGSTVECQPVDSDDNGYVSCTITWKDTTGETQYDSLECGVNRWYHGFKVSGCRPVWRR